MQEFLTAHPAWVEHLAVNGTPTGVVRPRAWDHDCADVQIVRVTQEWVAKAFHPMTSELPVFGWWQTVEIEGWPGLKAIRPIL